MTEAVYTISGCGSEASLSGGPHTPPYTPARITNRRFERSHSPASTVASVHPTDTHSPAPKAAQRVVNDEINVEELAEGDLGYMTDIDVVYPEELEEVNSSDAENDHSGDDFLSDSEPAGIIRNLSRLRTGDDQEVDFEQLRRQRHLERRTGSRFCKRTHSQSAKSESNMTDTDALDDHDLVSTRRRLRRRTQGPSEMSLPLEGLIHDSPGMCGSRTAGESPAPENAVHDDHESAMDLDGST